MDGRNHIRFKYLGSANNGFWNLVNIYVFQDILGMKHFIKWDFANRIISLDNSHYTMYEVPLNQLNYEQINITIETIEFITTQGLISKFERFAYQRISVQFANKMTSK